MIPRQPRSPLFPYTTLFRSTVRQGIRAIPLCNPGSIVNRFTMKNCQVFRSMPTWLPILQGPDSDKLTARSEEHTSELQSPYDLVCRLLLEKKKKQKHTKYN